MISSSLDLRMVVTAMQIPVIIFLILLSYQVFKSLKINAFKHIFFAWVFNGLYVIVEFLSFYSEFEPYLLKTSIDGFSVVCDLIATIFFLLAVRTANGVNNPLLSQGQLSIIKKTSRPLILFTALVIIFCLAKLIYKDLFNLIDGENIIQVSKIPLAILSFYALYSMAIFVKREDDLGEDRNYLHYAFLCYAFLQFLSVPYFGVYENIRITFGFVGGLLCKIFLLYGLHRAFIFNAVKTNNTEEVNKYLNRILGRTFHEITAPLKTAKNKIEELLQAEPVKYKLTRQAKHQIEIISSNYNRLVAVVGASMRIYEEALGNDFEQNIFDIPNEHLELGPNNINTLIETAIISLKETMSDEEVITITREYGSNCNLICYPTQVIQVIYNILKNSVDSFENKIGRIFIKTKRYKLNETPDTIRLLRIDIGDDGPGIPPDVIPDIFQEGFTTKLKKKSQHGYGLYIAKTLCEENQGTLEILSPYDFKQFHTGINSGTLNVIIFPSL